MKRLTDLEKRIGAVKAYSQVESLPLSPKERLRAAAKVFAEKFKGHAGLPRNVEGFIQRVNEQLERTGSVQGGGEEDGNASADDTHMEDAPGPQKRGSQGGESGGPRAGKRQRVVDGGGSGGGDARRGVKRKLDQVDADDIADSLALKVRVVDPAPAQAQAQQPAQARHGSCSTLKRRGKREGGRRVRKRRKALRGAAPAGAGGTGCTQPLAGGNGGGGSVSAGGKRGAEGADGGAGLTRITKRLRVV